MRLAENVWNSKVHPGGNKSDGLYRWPFAVLRTSQPKRKMRPCKTVRLETNQVTSYSMTREGKEQFRATMQG